MSKQIGDTIIMQGDIKVMVGYQVAVGTPIHGQPLIAITQQNHWEDKSQLPDLVKLTPATLQEILDWYHQQS